MLRGKTRASEYIVKEYLTEETARQQAALGKIDRWRSYANVGMISFMFFFFPLMSHAGGLGIAPLAFFIGVLGYLTARPSSILAIPSWFWLLAIFLIWANITTLWSPYDDKQSFKNAPKLAIGAVLYLGSILAFRSAVKTRPAFLSHFFLAVMTLGLGVLTIDLMSGYALTYMVDPLKPTEDPMYKNFSTEMNLGHAVTVCALFLPTTLALIRLKLPVGWLLAVIFAFMVLVAAIFAKLFVGVLCVVAILAVMFCTEFKPRLILRSLIWVAIFSILLAPFMGYLTGLASPEVKAAIPFSWEHRLEMWAYTADRIFEAPFMGHGFDAVRTYDQTFSSRGIEAWRIVSLHPHNAGLHLWAEVGLVGVAFAVTTILMMGIAAERFALASRLRAMATTGLVTVMIIVGNFTYGVWQDWWWAACILAVASLQLIPADKPVDTR